MRWTTRVHRHGERGSGGRAGDAAHSRRRRATSQITQADGGYSERLAQLHAFSERSPRDGNSTASGRQRTRHRGRALIEEEHTGARYLRKLANEENGIHSGLHSLLLEMMAMDSEKHARLLKFVHDRLAKRARTEDGSSD
jgi:hypothetical protein